MIRKFKINMTQKGDFNFMCSRLIKEGIIKFQKTNNPRVEIVEIDWSKLKLWDRAEEYYAKKRGIKGYLTKREDAVKRVLRIDKSNPYRELSKAKEIRSTDIEGYVQVSTKVIEFETEKAYIILSTPIAKSQTLVKGDRLYIKEWLFYRNF